MASPSSINETTPPMTSNRRSMTSFTVEPPDAMNRRLKFYPIYCHHLSSVALQHLQNTKRDWILKNALDKGLRLNPDGTFVLYFPAPRKGVDGGRIWTSYDGSKKQHWLSVYKEQLVGRFLLKDTRLEQSVEHEETVNANVRSSVDRMIAKLQELEEQQSGGGRRGH